MKSKWIIHSHHIAIKSGNEVLHPDAREVYSFLNETNHDVEAGNPVFEMPEVYFSNVGSPVRCEMFSSETNEIYIEIYALRKNKKVPVDMIQGQIIDHCISDKEWFYLIGGVESLQTLLANAGIETTGNISIGQYINLVKQEYFTEYKEIGNNVSFETVKNILGNENTIPQGIRAELYDYQKTGYSWIKNMIDAGQGCIQIGRAHV